MIGSVREFARLGQTANGQPQGPVLFGRQVELLGDDAGLDGLVVRLQDVGQDDRLELAGSRRCFFWKVLRILG